MTNFIGEATEIISLAGAIQQLIGSEEFQAEASNLAEDGKSIISSIKVFEGDLVRLYGTASPALLAKLEKYVPWLKPKPTGAS